MSTIQNRICVVIPTFKAKTQILKVIEGIGSEVDKIIIIDDACPQNSGDYVKRYCKDPRVEIIHHDVNQGVGGAVKTGYVRALQLEFDAIVKIDSDGQMDPLLIPQFVKPIFQGEADYTKGNRFYYDNSLSQMPKIRLIGNFALSYLAKVSTGYYKIFDCNNGYTAISKNMLSQIPISKIDNSYFFESSMLFRLGLHQARVKDIQIKTIYLGETSNLKIRRALFEFTIKHLQNAIKRIYIRYFFRNFKKFLFID